MRPAVTVHGRAQAEAALAAAGAGGVLLLSAPGAGAFTGPRWFLDLAELAASSHPGVTWEAALDCADAAGTALAALRAGARMVVLDGAVATYPAVAAAGAAQGAVVLPARPDSLDLARLDLRRPRDRVRLADWLAKQPP